MIGQSTTCASSVGQAAALVALTSDQTCIAEAAAMYRSRRDRMLELLSEESGLDLVGPAGAFYLYVSVAALLGRRTPAGKLIQTDRALSLYLLQEATVAVRAGGAYGLLHSLRLAL